VPSAGARAMSPRKKGSGALPEIPLQISNPDKVFWPEEGYTKLDLMRFYMEVFEKLEPYVADRLLSLERCPDGMAGECFYQKEKPPGMPPDTPTKRIQHEKGTTNYVVGGKLVTQLALVNLGCIAIHVWNSRKASPRKPDWVCFDLDPDSGQFSDAARAGLKVKEALDALKLVSFPKTSGKKGLHIFVPIRPGPDCDQVREFADRLGHRLAQAFPKELTMETRIAARKGRVYLDPFRNGFAQTIVSPYSVRRAPKAPVSTPLSWAEVKPTLTPADFNIGNFAKRLATKDPWTDFFESRQPLAGALKAIRSL
jgi:bifunctional non-homologous end joining protein LigD